MKYLIFLIILFPFSELLGQSKNFGEVSMEELKMTSYEKDKDANAVVLFDVGESKFIDSEINSGYDIQFTRKRRVKIFDASDENIAEVAIPYYVDGYGRTELIVSLEAHTVTLKGELKDYKKVSSVSIFDEKINNNWNVKKFIFPGVEDGAIIEYKYVLETPFHFNLPDWRFQDYIPTIYSEYKVSMIPFYEYVFLVQGVSKFDYQNAEISNVKRKWGQVNKSYGQNVGTGIEFKDYVYTYVLKDIPAFKDESYISSVNDYIIKIDFQLARYNSPTGGKTEIISTWPELIDDLLKQNEFGRYLKGCSKYARKIISELDLNGSEKDKAQVIVNYVKDNFRWNGRYDKYAFKSPKEFFTQKEGNAAEVNLFLISMLSEAGIDTKPVILSSRGNGKIKSDYPFKHFFNYVIAFINFESPILVDATEPLLPVDRIPARCLNDKALIVDKEKVNFIDLRTSASSLNSKTLLFNEIDTSSFNCNIDLSIQTTEYETVRLKQKFVDNEEKIKEYFSNGNASFDEITSYNYDNNNRPYILNLKGSTELGYLGENIVIKPFASLVYTENPFTQKRRSYPVDFIYPFEDEFVSAINIPEGYQASTLPEGIEIDNDLAEIILTYSVTGNTLNVKGSYNFKKAVYYSNEYARIKYYFNEIIEKFNREVVLEKI